MNIKIAAIVLAAGQSKRFGSENKLLANYKGQPLFTHCLDLVSSLPFTQRILVTGHEAEQVEKSAINYGLEIAHNPNFATGMGSSLSTGVKALDQSCGAFMVFLADMPELSRSLVNSLFEEYEKKQHDMSIVRPAFEDVNGHPVLFAAKHALALKSLKGDQGAKELIDKMRPETVFFNAGTRACIRDIDTKPQL